MNLEEAIREVCVEHEDCPNILVGVDGDGWFAQVVGWESNDSPMEIYATAGNHTSAEAAIIDVSGKLMRNELD